MTQFGIIYDLKDTTALSDSTAVTANNISFADIGLFRENKTFPDYGTLEQNYFLLEGSHPELPDAPQGIAFFTAPLSDGAGRYSKNPLLTILFTQNHTSTGLTFYFVGEWPLDMRIRWYDLEGHLLDDRVFLPDQASYYARNLVENYGRLEIEFRRTKPYRYIRLAGIDYGVTVEWDEHNIKDASLTEETDPVSDKIPINKLSFKFVDAENEFNVGNQNGLHRALQKRQHISPYEIVDGSKISLGRYFLDTSASSANVVNMTAVDYKGLLDNTDFTEGRVYSGELAGKIIAAILDATGIPFQVDQETYNTRLSGWLAVQTRRKALREVLFACGSLVDTSGLDYLRIYKPVTDTQGRLPRSRKFTTTTKEDPYVSDVSIKITAYAEGAEIKEITKGPYGAGINTVQFSAPVVPGTVAVTGGTLIESKTNYAVLSVPAAGEVVITGRQYVRQDTTITEALTVPDQKAGENKNSKTYNGTLLDPARAKIIAENILQYYGYRLMMDVKYLSAGERPGIWADVENAVRGRGSFAACFESIRTDLTGGYISTAKLRGYYHFATAYDYAGEVYAADGVGVM